MFGPPEGSRSGIVVARLGVYRALFGLRVNCVAARFVQREASLHALKQAVSIISCII